MLVLSRKKSESIVIDNSVIVTLLEIRGDRVRLGVVAPREVPVHREEIQKWIQAGDQFSKGKPMREIDNAAPTQDAPAADPATTAPATDTPAADPTPTT